MENLETINKIMKEVEGNLELSIAICKEYGFHSTADYLEKALVCMNDAKYTKVLEESQKIEIEQAEIKKAIEESTEKAIEMVSPQLSAEEAKEMIETFEKVGREEVNGC